MSQKPSAHRSQRRPAPPTTPPPFVTISDLSERAQEIVVASRNKPLDTRLVDPEIIRCIVAEGPFNGDAEVLDSAVEGLAVRKFNAAKLYQILDEFGDALAAAGVNTQVPSTNEDRESEHFIDTVFNYAFAYAQAGYLVGVAVGQEMAGAR